MLFAECLPSLFRFSLPRVRALARSFRRKSFYYKILATPVRSLGANYIPNDRTPHGPAMSTLLIHSYVVLSAIALTLAQSTDTLPAPAQPQHSGTPGTFEIIGESLVSAQQVGHLPYITLSVVDMLRSYS